MDNSKCHGYTFAREFVKEDNLNYSPKNSSFTTFVNLGTADVQVHGVPLSQRQSFSFASGNASPFYIDKTSYRIEFGNTGTRNLLVIQQVFSN